MKMRMFLALGLMLAASAAAALALQQNDAKNLFQQYVEKYGPPGPEHKMLDPLVGTWQARCRMWIDPAQPPQASDGTLVRKSIMGGRFLQENFEGSIVDRPAQGIGYLGFDRAKKKYVMTWLDSVSTAIQMSYGTYANGVWTFTHEDTCPITGKHAKMRDTLRIVSPNEQELTMYRQLAGEQEMRTMEIILTKQK
jgi:hypothetical protein